MRAVVKTMWANNNNDGHADTLACVDGVVHYSRGDERLWSLDVGKLSVIGEFTCDSFADDYFLVFVTQDGSCFQSSFYATGRDRCLEALSAILAFRLSCGLCNSVEFRSRVLWPAALTDSPLLQDRSIPPANFFDRIRSALGLADSEYPLSEAVLTYLGIQASPG